MLRLAWGYSKIKQIILYIFICCVVLILSRQNTSCLKIYKSFLKTNYNELYIHYMYYNKILTFLEL